MFVGEALTNILPYVGRKTREMHGVEVDQSSSTIFGHMTAGNVRFFLMISFLYLSSLMQDKFFSCETIG